MAITLAVLAFVFVSLSILAMAMLVSSGGTAVIDRRLRELQSALPSAGDVPARSGSMFGVFKRVGNRLPRSPREMSKLRLRLTHAGFRHNDALAVFFGIRAATALGLFLIFSTPVLMRPNMMAAVGGVLLGYVVPGIIVARLAKRRQHRIRLALADTLDLLVVSVEAGLGLDQALQRVGDELAFVYPELSSDLRLVNLELRAGTNRPEALRNLADRAGVQDLSALVAMLIQTDRFGTSVSKSLRVHDQAPAASGRSRGEDRRQDGVSPRVLHLSGHLDRDDRSGGHPVRQRALSDHRARPMIPSRADLSSARVLIRNVDTNRLLADRLACATGRLARARGLLGRPSLPSGEARWIAPCRGVHTCGMRFPIDVVALDVSGTVVDVVSDLRPWCIRLPRPGAVGVLELPHGTAEASSTQIGHHIKFEVIADVDITADGRD